MRQLLFQQREASDKWVGNILYSLDENFRQEQHGGSKKGQQELDDLFKMFIIYTCTYLTIVFQLVVFSICLFELVIFKLAQMVCPIQKCPILN
jgi:hypothetical protein